jgi:hypothetical protein
MRPSPYELTKLDIAAIRHADYFVLWLDSHGVVGSHVDFVKRAPDKSVANPYPVDLRHTLPAPIWVAYDYAAPSQSWSCCTSVYLYWSSLDSVTSALKTLRAGDSIAFEFYPDGHSNQYVRDAGLHTDFLRLRVYRKGEEVGCWEVSQSTCPDNSARMCKPIVKQYVLTTDA